MESLGTYKRWTTVMAVLLALWMPLAAEAQQNGAGRVLRVATWGGDWGVATEQSVAHLVKAATGARVEYVFGNPVDNLTRLIAARGSVPFDVMDLDPYTEQEMLRLGLIEPIDHSKFPEFSSLYPEAILNDRYGPAWNIIDIIIAWFPERFRQLGLPDPDSFDDLLHPALAGRWAFPDIRVGFTPNILAALAYHWTGDPGNVIPALERLRSGSPRIYGATPEMTTWLASGDVHAAVTYTSQAALLKERGIDVSFVHPRVGDRRGIVYWNQTQIIKGTPNRDLAEAFIRARASFDGQLGMFEHMKSLPTNMEVAAHLREVRPDWRDAILRPEDMARMFQADTAFVVANRSAWVDAWNRAMSR